MAAKEFSKIQVLLYVFWTILGLSEAFSCPSGLAGLIPDPTDCSRYYQCFSGQTYQFSCPAGTVFNPTANYCDWPYNVQCSSSPTTSATTTTTASTTTTTAGTATTVSLVSSTSSSCAEYVSISASWSGKMGGKLVIPVKNRIHKSYSLTVTTHIPLTKLKLWTVDVTPSSGTTFTITPKSWFYGQSAGSVLSLGFQASFQGSTKPVFTSMVLDDRTEVRDICRSSSNPTIAPTVAPTVIPTVAPTVAPTLAPTIAPTTTSGSSTPSDYCNSASIEPITPEIKEMRRLSCLAPNSVVDAIQSGSATNPDNVKIVESIFSSTDFSTLFPQADPAYTYQNFLKAIGKFPSICATKEICKKTLATMFAHFQQETAGLFYLKEINKSDYCANWSAWINNAYPCIPGKQYFGRGSKQLSWNYNYGAFSEAMFGDTKILLNDPDQVSDTWLNFASAMWFYVTPQPPKPSMLAVVDGTWTPNSSDKSKNLIPGFGATTMIINGALECGAWPSNQNASPNRQKWYREYANHFGFSIAAEKLDCADMQQFDASGSSNPAMYWSPESGCKLATWQTAYSALIEGNYARCQNGL